MTKHIICIAAISIYNMNTNLRRFSAILFIELPFPFLQLLPNGTNLHEDTSLLSILDCKVLIFVKKERQQGPYQEIFT